MRKKNKPMTAKQLKDFNKLRSAFLSAYLAAYLFHRLALLTKRAIKHK